MNQRETDPALDASLGWLLVVVILVQAVLEWGGGPWAETVQILAVLAMAGLLVPGASKGGRIFLVVAVLSSLIVVLTREDWPRQIRGALLNAGFFAGFFSALTILRNAADSSAAMRRAGTYLAMQAPGRRYVALTAGTHAFALFLNYGAIQLMGSLAMASAEAERDARIKAIRARRMLLAIHRGFVSSLTWSPMGFAVIISLAAIPGTSYAAIALPGLVTSAIIMGTGWAMDAIFKPRLAGPRPPPLRSGLGPRAMAPLALLLAIVVVPVLLLERLSGIRVVGIVLALVPLISLIWIAIQTRGMSMRRRLHGFVTQDLPGYRTEVTLIVSAGYLGAVGAAMAGPVMTDLGIDLRAMPVWALLLGLVWIMPLLGQLGANPILSMSLIVPLLPSAAASGLSPSALAVALIAGWTMTGITSPFTAATLLIARFAGIRAWAVGWVWNRAYFVVTILLLSIWVLVHAAMTARGVT